ncbi:hypothetical protein JZ751_027275 [Albula glossodonta]|uniref:Serine/threonine kinase 19 n=1 Tax=Albula glossodonta TaxID=121402 RepID=A0A8T2MWT5_9TELE|nr:hypothetical protein JZ751_027275 [Albula glossodonta]
MNRKRTLISDTFMVKRRNTGTDKQFGTHENGEFSTNREGPLDVRAALEYLMTLFPRKLFNDTLPPLVMKHQLYSLHGDKTQNALRERGELLMFQLGFDAEAFGLIFTADYRAKVLAGETGRETLPTVEKFLDTVLPNCSELSFDKDKMHTKFQFTDTEITQLVKSGVLTVRDAGSWWLSIPNSGRFTKLFIQGRRAVLAMVKKSKYSEVLRSDLESRRTTTQVKFHIKYHVHDIIGAELVECISTSSGTLLRLTET